MNATIDKRVLRGSACVVRCPGRLTVQLTVRRQMAALGAPDIFATNVIETVDCSRECAFASPLL